MRMGTRIVLLIALIVLSLGQPAGLAAQDPSGASALPAAVSATITTITGVDGGASLVGQSYYVRFRVVADPYNGTTPYGVVTVDDGESHTCSKDMYVGYPGFDEAGAWEWGCILTSTTAGTKTLTATFVPHQTVLYSGSTDTYEHQVLMADTATTLARSPNPSAGGQPVTLTAAVNAVAPADIVPTGTVTFYTDGLMLGKAALDGSGLATLSTSTLELGTRVLTAVYSGDANCYESGSDPVGQFVLDADLRVMQMVTPDGAVRAGDPITYTVVVDNLGPSTASGLALTDTLTASGTYMVTSILPSAGSCTPATPAAPSGSNNQVQIGCSLNDLAAGERWTIVVGAVAQQAIDMANVASVLAASPTDPNMSNNAMQGAVAVTAAADLEIVKTADYEGVVAGQSAYWTVTVYNNGPSAAQNVRVVEVLPAGMVDGSLTTTWQGCTLGTPGDPTDPMVCNLGTLAAGQEVSFGLAGDVDPAFVLNQPDSPAANYLDNDAWVDSDTFDPDNSNNRDTDYVSVTAQGDLSLTKVAVGVPVPGSELHYEIQVTNAGPSWAEDVTLREYLPSGVEFVSAVANREDGSGEVPITCSVAAGSNVLYCELGNVPLTGFAPILVIVNVRVAPDATGSLVNTADVSLSDTPDPNASNNSASTTSSLTHAADVEIVKASEPATVYAGEQIIYTLTVTNNGPSTAFSPLVTDTLPEGVTYEVASAPCEATGQDVACTLEDLVPGESHALNIWARANPNVAPGTILENTATVTWALGDGSQFDATATASSLAQSKADLRVIQYGEPAGDVLAGEVLTLTYVVDNLGPGNAHGVTLTGRLPRGLEWLWEESSLPASCDGDMTVAGMEWACTLDDPLEAQGRWTVILEVGALDALTITSVSDVSSDDLDPNMGNNHAEVVREFAGAADLYVNTDVDDYYGPLMEGPSGLVAGTKWHEFRIQVHNWGLSAATNVVVESVLPAGIIVTDVYSFDGSCTIGTPGDPQDPMVCGLGTVDTEGGLFGATAWFDEIIVEFALPPDLPAHTVLQFNARVTSDVYDPNNENNYESETHFVSLVADVEIDKVQMQRYVSPGNQIDYRIMVRNDGPSDALGTIVIDDMPDGLTYVSWTCQGLLGASCPASGEGSLLLESVDLPARSMLLYSVHGVRHPASAGQTLVNQAMAMPHPYNVTDPYMENNLAEVSNVEYVTHLPMLVGRPSRLWAPDLVVDSIKATSSSVSVTLRNRGTLAVTDRFWVDVYLDPLAPPKGVNETWQLQGDMGLVWAVDRGALPLEPGETLTLTVGDAYYADIYSHVVWPLAAGTPVYAQVDSAGEPAYGAVLETHEIRPASYNNISGPLSVVSAAGPAPQMQSATPRHYRGLPPR